MGEEKSSVEIPLELYKKIEERVRETEFNSVSEYVTFVLEEVLKDEDEGEEQDTVLSEEDEEKIKERLRGLGYL